MITVTWLSIYLAGGIIISMDSEVKNKLINFFSKYKKIEFSKGEPLIEADQNPGGVFYLIDGVVKEYVVNAQGVEVVLNLYKADSFFPMSWVINKKALPHYFEAMAEAVVWKASPDDFLSFLKSDPDVMLDLLKRIYKGMEGMWLRLEYSMSGSAYEKFISELLIFAKRFGIRDGAAVILDFKIFEKDLAAQTGVARETVSRLISKLKEKKLVDFKDNRIYIQNLEKLEDELTPRL